MAKHIKTYFSWKIDGPGGPISSTPQQNNRMDWNSSYDYDWRGDDYQGNDIYCYPGDPDYEFEDEMVEDEMEELSLDQMNLQQIAYDIEEAEEVEKYEALALHERKIFEEESAIVSEIQAEWEKAPVKPEDSSEIDWRELDAIERNAYCDWMKLYNKDVGKSLIRWANPSWTVAKEKAFLTDLYFRATQYDDDSMLSDAIYAQDALSILGVSV